MDRILKCIYLFLKSQDFFFKSRLKNLSCDYKSLSLVKQRDTWQLALVQKMQYVCYKAGIQNLCPL